MDVDATITRTSGEARAFLSLPRLPALIQGDTRGEITRSFLGEGAGLFFCGLVDTGVKMTKQEKSKYDKAYRKRRAVHLSVIRDQWKKSHPFHIKLSMVRQRCSDPKKDNYKFYGGKGIKCFLTVEQLQILWNRDQASTLKSPSLDRIDSSGDYTIENCRFVEMADNLRRAHPRKTHCKHGHAFDSVNVRIRPDGYRECRICRRDIYRRWVQRQMVTK